MSSYLKGRILIGLLLIGSVFFLFVNQYDKGIVGQDTGSGKSSLKKDLPCISMNGAGSCKDQEKVDELRSGYSVEIIIFWHEMYKHMDDFLLRYETQQCIKDKGGCWEMIQTELFTVNGHGDGAQGFQDSWSQLMTKYKQNITGNLGEQVQTIDELMTPVLNEMTWYDNQGLLTKNEYWTDLTPIVRGLQNSIKYRLRSYFRSEEYLLPWEFTTVEK